MLTIRLSRIGKKNKPMYRLIISEKTKDPYGRALEILGSYNPYTKELQTKNDRIKHWLNQGAKLSATANNLLVEKNVIKGEKVKASTAKNKKKGKTENKKTTEEAEKDESAKKPAENKSIEEKKPE